MRPPLAVFIAILIIMGLWLIIQEANKRNRRNTVRDLIGGPSDHQAVKIPSGKWSVGRGNRSWRSLAGSFAPPSYRSRLDDRLNQAGLARVIFPDDVIAAQALGFLGVIALFVALNRNQLVAQRLAPLLLLLLLLVVAVAPSALIQRRVDHRRVIIARRVPDFLDLMTLSIQAGLALDSALVRVGEHMQGPLGEEIRRTTADISLGQSRQMALDGLDKRLDVTEVSTFVMALTQADELGSPVGQVLAGQAATARDRQRQQEQERMNRLPVKILLPTALLILPPTLIVVLGPAMSTIGAMFG